MRRLPAAVTIVTTGTGGKRNGFTATAVCSVSAEPPHLLVCANREMATCGFIRATGYFAVNLLRHDQAALAERFGGRGGFEGEERFRRGNWQPLASGTPGLIDACAVFECQVVELRTIATHDVVIGKVLDVRSDPSCDALVYVDRDYTTIARLQDEQPVRG